MINTYNTRINTSFMLSLEDGCAAMMCALDMQSQGQHNTKWHIVHTQPIVQEFMQDGWFPPSCINSSLKAYYTWSR